MKGIKVLVLHIMFFIIGTSTAIAQTTEQVTKKVVWTKIEDGYQVQLIQEGDFEYILRSPLSTSTEVKIKSDVSSTDAAKNAAYSIITSAASRRVINPIAEIQSDDLIKSRLYYLNSPLPLTYNQDVRKQVDRLLRYRTNLEKNLGRSQYYMPMIDSIVIAKNMPSHLKYLPLVESEYKIGGRSRRGARGIWQFMSPTARMYGMKVSSVTDQRLDPKQSTEAAMTYLNDLYDIFGDWELALAAYNAGPGRVRKAIRQSGLENPTFWEIRHLLARETREYVPKFTAAVYVMEHYQSIGLIPNNEGLTDAAEQSAKLKKINYRSTYNPNVDYGAIPKNSVALKYTVKSGDNIGYIAEWYDVKASQIRAWNGFSGNLIKAGQELAIYVPKEKETVYADINRLSFDQKQGADSEEKEVERRQQLAALEADIRNYVVYTIQKGDTLWDISRKNGVSVETIKKLNNISNTRNLKPGMILKIREKS